MQITFTTSNVAENWRRFERQFRVYYAACELQLKSKTMQVGILLHTAGAEAQYVHETFDYAVGEDKDDYALVLTQFRTYCEPRKTIVFERYQFWGRKERLLRETDLTLARSLDVCRAAKTSKHQMDTMGAAHTQIHAMHM